MPIIAIAPSIAPICLTSCSHTHFRLTRDDWENQTKTALNQCISNYGVDGKNYSKDNYVVFDFDNTTAIFDIQHQCTTYQIDRMAYNLTDSELTTALSADLGDLDRVLTGYDFTYRNLIGDIVNCYSALQTQYGPFSYKGVAESKLTELHNEDDWKDFNAKLHYLYSVVANIEGDKVRGKWSTYQFTNMTPEQVRELEYNCLIYASSLDSEQESVSSVTKITGSNTTATATYLQGVSVSENIKELYKTIKDNGIDIWIISASQVDQVRGAADAFGLSQYVSGVFGLTNKLGNEGKYIAEYDDNGKGYIRKDNKWELGKENPYHTSGVGKSDTIVNSIAPNYNNHGPIMCFGDSTGDFNFCSEFKDTKLVVCFNRADRSVTDGGGLMSAIAMYQKLNDVTLAKAVENKDTLYLLQGRNENGKRSFISSNKTIRLGSSEEALFKNKENYKLLYYIMSNNLSIANACNLSIKGTVIEDITVGFLDSYAGYHKK